MRDKLGLKGDEYEHGCTVVLTLLTLSPEPAVQVENVYLFKQKEDFFFFFFPSTTPVASCDLKLHQCLKR